MTKIFAFVPDLMDRSKFGNRVEFVSKATQLDGLEVDLLILDLNRVEDIEIWLKPGIKTIGYSSHVDKGVIEQAKLAGVDQVLPRSAFFSQLPEILDNN